MSFSSDVKMEIVRLENTNECCMKSELSAIFKLGADIILSSSGLKIEYRSTNPSIIKKVLTLVKTLFNAEVELKTKRWMKLNKSNMYYLTVLTNTKAILNALNLDLVDDRRIPEFVYQKDCCKRSFLRGAFLTGGSVNSPVKSSYHLEISAPYELIIKDIADLINGFHFNAKVSNRSKSFLTYIKKSELISDFLKLIGATSESMNYENIRIEREVSYQVERTMNVDLANTEKSIKSANEQIIQIELIKKTYQDNIPERIKEIIKLREKYPEGSMQELSDKSLTILGNHLSKSGINHRFRSVKELYDDIIKKQN